MCECVGVTLILSKSSAFLNGCNYWCFRLIEYSRVFCKLTLSLSLTHTHPELYWELMSREMSRDHSSTDDQANINLALDKANIKSELNYLHKKSTKFLEFTNILH